MRGSVRRRRGWGVKRWGRGRCSSGYRALEAMSSAAIRRVVRAVAVATTGLDVLTGRRRGRAHPVDIVHVELRYQLVAEDCFRVHVGRRDRVREAIQFQACGGWFGGCRVRRSGGRQADNGAVNGMRPGCAPGLGIFEGPPLARLQLARFLASGLAQWCESGTASHRS